MTTISVEPRLVVAGADRAIDFYRRAFDAELVQRQADAEGNVVHAELCIGANVVTLKEEDGVDRAPSSLGGTAVVLGLAVDDADAVGAALEAAGARVIFAIGDSPYGRRDGRLEDPFGHQWLVSQPLV